MAEKSWLRKIGLLKKLLEQTGPLWPDSTKLAGYGNDGKYYCGRCEYLKGIKSGEIFIDEHGMGRCGMEVMIADIETLKDEKGIPIVDVEKGCCEFIEIYDASPEDEGK